ncbi:MAG: GNAT family N-acetyltransferase [Chloroflexi bacterium]|nr:GNAT family N-acetyltransferase [Chloroflexota bacterium]
MSEAYEVRQGEYVISVDPALLDLGFIHSFLTRSYWANGVSEDIVARSIGNSICFGAYKDGKQVGFARAVTDRATFAFLADVFVIESERGNGLGKLLVEAALNHPELGSLRRWLLATDDAHSLYELSGFVPLRKPGRWMEIHEPYVEASS